jgi:hypothetical protein
MQQRKHWARLDKHTLVTIRAKQELVLRTTECWECVRERGRKRAVLGVVLNSQSCKHCSLLSLTWRDCVCLVTTARSLRLLLDGLPATVLLMGEMPFDRQRQTTR